MRGVGHVPQLSETGPVEISPVFMEERAVGIGRFQEVRSWKSYSHSPYYNHQDYYMLKDPLVAGVAFGGTSREVVETVYHEGRMRTLTDHIVSGDQAVQLTIEVTDEPGA